MPSMVCDEIWILGPCRCEGRLDDEQHHVPIDYELHDSPLDVVAHVTVRYAHVDLLPDFTDASRWYPVEEDEVAVMTDQCWRIGCTKPVPRSDGLGLCTDCKLALASA